MTEPDGESARFVRSIPALLVTGTYLALIGWHLAAQACGDSPVSPFGYFWTWDMYPGYETERVRRVVVAETDDGRALRLAPSPDDRFRWGMHGDAARIDLDRRDAALERLVEQRLARRRDTDGRIVRVRLFERRRPARLALVPHSDALPAPGRDSDGYWRIVAEGEVSIGNRVAWNPRR